LTNDVALLIIRNAETIQEFWQSWNMPAHKWALR